jgi:hypothetical protein
MELLTVESVTREALKILNDTYAKQYRTQIGGNEYVHQAAPTNSDETPTGSIQTFPSRID